MIVAWARVGAPKVTVRSSQIRQRLLMDWMRGEGEREGGRTRKMSRSLV